MKAKRKVTAAVVSLTLVALMMVGLTLAYLTDQRNVVNFLGFGRDKDDKASVQISLTEPKFQAYAAAKGYVVETLPGTGLEKEVTKVRWNSIIPGDSITKDPTVTNKGERDVYLRIKLTIKDDADGKKLKALEDDLGFKVNLANYKKVGAYYYYVGTNTNSTCAKLTQGQSTEFFAYQGNAADKVSLIVPKRYTTVQIEKLGLMEMTITAQAIQADHLSSAIPWADVDGEITEAEITAVDNSLRK